MDADAQLTLLTIDEYMERERHSATRHEYVDGELFAFAGASKRHIDIVLNIAEALRPVAREQGCRLFANDLMVQVTATRIYYPDVVVVCSRYDDSDDYLTRHPCMVVEVVSPSTGSTDRREKLQTYRRVAGLREYLIVEQASQRIERQRHWTEDGDAWWRAMYITGAVPVACLNTEIELDAVYRDVQFDRES